MRSIAVVGLGNFGSRVARELAQRGAQVIAIDENRERVESIKDEVAYAATLDSTSAGALRSVAITDVDLAVVCIGDDVEANLLTTLLLKKLGVKKIWARAINPLQQEILAMIEVDEVINLEEEMGRTVARSLLSYGATKHIPLSPGHSIAEVPLPKSFAGRTLRQIDPRGKYNVNVVAIKTFVPAISDQGERSLVEHINDLPPPDEKLADEVILLVAGSDRDIEHFARG